MSSSRVDQRQAAAGGDVVAGDKVTNIQAHHHYAAPTVGPAIIEELMRRLAAEIRDNQQVREMVDSLQYFHHRFSHDGIDGLEAKLDRAGRAHQLKIALFQKEAFVKFLDKYSLYGSAQEIFAYLLHKIDHQFRCFVHPNIEHLDFQGVDQLITDRIVDPVIKELGVGVFVLNSSIVMGMIYWLAEQCFIRWHK